MTSPKASKRRYVYRSASTGRFVKASTAKRHPRITVRQRIRLAPCRKK